MENTNKILIEDFKTQNYWYSFHQQILQQEKEDKIINQHN